ncbi:MAG TPA: choice-of-anchor Q domain-containing protein [Acidimicrobiales bacterium]|nr:choice-of-anchor Q domain-containing protein [Acidimicrobiales bacterium]
MPYGQVAGGAVFADSENLTILDSVISNSKSGYPTLTHRPLPGSPAIDAGDPAIPSPPATDQRGFARIFGPAVDLGAVEAQPGIVEVSALSRLGMLVLAALLFAAGLWRLSPDH